MLENIKKILIAIPLIFLAIIPPMELSIPMTINSDLWIWSILLGGLLGILFIYTRADIFLKLIVVYLFINCFRSRAPYLSFTSYIIFIAVAYYYLLCLTLKDFEFVKKIAQAVFFLNIILIVNQQFGGDKLLNFGRDIPVCFGTIGNSMWLGSLLICLAPFLLLSSPLNIIPLIIIIFISKSSGMALSLLGGVLIYGFMKFKKKIIFWITTTLIIFGILIYARQDRVFSSWKAGRGPIWKRTIELSNKHPFFGWGIGTARVIVPALSGDVSGGYPGPWEYEGTKGNWLAWRQVHNCWLQMDFEVGKIGDILILLFLGSILFALLKLPKTQEVVLALSGIGMISSNMLIHYPTRMCQSVLFLIIFVVFCQQLIKRRVI